MSGQTNTLTVDERDAKTIARILKVNHAGECGAIRIYQAQIWISRWRQPDMLSFLEETLRHEIEHRDLFRNAMPTRKARPCRALWTWGIGGWVLGATTALAGSHFVWICTEAVEETVHRHLEEQVAFVRERDPELMKLILSIQAEELSHLDEARTHIECRGTAARMLQWGISMATETVIWLSTQGDSTKMATAIHRAGPSR